MPAYASSTARARAAVLALQHRPPWFDRLRVPAAFGLRPALRVQLAVVAVGQLIGYGKQLSVTPVRRLRH
ncbi:hypothetical protein RKE30_08770 [Streptomyces sp. Li-HN-5-11]|uniref:hypothetical protein n=1 Tax=Streptomyces sp. Li-HN-5-11 TaxID=3075432 RepID=UPI0028AA043F|nr:hypothetical protein [Streptomyces sp. Li-HN-5-11]WNM30491.1 hypothetical protein RKE30_08770 [Streptomyces sp. Li-HN-5-11]